MDRLIDSRDLVDIHGKTTKILLSQCDYFCVYSYCYNNFHNISEKCAMIRTISAEYTTIGCKSTRKKTIKNSTSKNEHSRYGIASKIWYWNSRRSPFLSEPYFFMKRLSRNQNMKFSYRYSVAYLSFVMVCQDKATLWNLRPENAHWIFRKVSRPTHKRKSNSQ